MWLQSVGCTPHSACWLLSRTRSKCPTNPSYTYENPCVSSANRYTWKWWECYHCCIWHKMKSKRRAKLIKFTLREMSVTFYWDYLSNHWDISKPQEWSLEPSGVKEKAGGGGCHHPVGNIKIRSHETLMSKIEAPFLIRINWVHTRYIHTSDVSQNQKVLVGSPAFVCSLSFTAAVEKSTCRDLTWLSSRVHFTAGEGSVIHCVFPVTLWKQFCLPWVNLWVCDVLMFHAWILGV